MSSLQNWMLQGFDRKRLFILDPPEDATVGPNAWTHLLEATLRSGARVTNAKNIAIATKIQSRRPQDTQIVFGQPSAELQTFLQKVRDTLASSKAFLRKRVIAGQNNNWRTCVSLISPTETPHIPLYWGTTLDYPHRQEHSEFLTLSLPSFPEQHIYIFPDEYVTVVTGIDYIGEHKMTFLRLMMYKAFQHGSLGCHAASKGFLLHDKEGKPILKGALIFGLSGTGKTTLTCDSHGLQDPERIFISQDDIVIFTPEGSAIGTEQNFYVKTEGISPKNQSLIYQAATSPAALLENVFVDERGNLDFCNTSISSNGRAVIWRSHLLYANDAPPDLKRVDSVFFITRRYDIVPPLARLSPEWAAIAFLLGESQETSAGDPTKAGQMRRVPGFDPFMIVDPALVTNRFYEILRANPHIQCFQLNTGMIGERRKITPQESACMIEAVMRGTAQFEENPMRIGYDVAIYVPKVNLTDLDPGQYYDKRELRKRNKALLKDRRNYLEQHRAKLHPEIARILSP